MISFELLWETIKKKGISQYKLIKEYKISTGQLDRLRKTGMSAPTPSTSSASVLLGAGRQKKGDLLVYALVTKDGVERYREALR